MNKSNMSNQPNILLIILDTMRPDHLGCYGYSKQTSPHIDKVASEGVIFKNTFSTSPWTLPSHGSIMTGTYVSRHCIDKGSETIDKSLLTLAEYLNRNDYQTVGLSSNIWISETTGMNRGFERFKYVNELPFQRTLNPNIVQKVVKEIYWRYLFKRYDYGARKVNTLICNFINDQWNHDKPFFIFVNYLETHLQYKPPKKFRRMFIEKYEESLIKKINQDANKYNAGLCEMSEEDFKILQRLYDAEIKYVDSRIGEVLEFLEKEKILDNTLIIITSDHGENLGEHGLMDHQFSLHDTVIRIPLIIRYPGLFDKGQVIEYPAQTVDIFPTIADTIRLSKKYNDIDQLQGVSLLNAKVSSVKRNVFAEYLKPRYEVFENHYPDHDWSPLKRKLRMIRTNIFKLIVSSDGNDILYDIKNDPCENDNVLSSFPLVAKELRKKLNEWTETIANGTKDNAIEYNEDIIRVLRGLGYL